jgi:Synergist-CTERM protein sorting domain-containing protein
MDISVVSDLTFSDALRTVLSGEDEDDDDPPVLEPVTIIPDDDGTVSHQIVIDVQALGIELDAEYDKLVAMGLRADTNSSGVLITGRAVNTGTATLTIETVNGDTTVRITVTALPPESGSKADPVPSTWTGTLIEGDDGVYRFTVYVPVNLTAAEIAQLDDSSISRSVTANVTDSTGVRARFVKLAGEYVIEIYGETDDPDEATVVSVAYQIGIHQYTQAINGKIADAPLERSGGRRPSGGGCDAGFGALALGSLAPFAVLKKRTSR